MSRARALTALDAVDLSRRGYDGARGGRRAASLAGGMSSANVEVGPALSKLRARSRDLARNTWQGARILDVTVGHAIGTGITAVPATGSDRADRQLGEAWREWCEQADIEGVQSFEGLQALSLRSMLEGGDVAIRRIRRQLDGKRSVPFALQALEGDHIDGTRDGRVQERNARLGIGLGEWNERTGAWLYRDHPGESTFQAASLTSEFVDRDGLIHLHRPTRLGQVRGVPVFAPILMPARDLADLMEAVVVKAKVEACFSAFVKRDPSQLGPVGKPDPTQKRVEQLAPGMINYMEPGDDITFGQPSSSGQSDPIMLRVLLAMAAGAGITYDQLTGDLRQANYSSLRAGKIEFRRLIEQLQWLTLVPQVMRPVTSWFIDTATLAGRLRDRKGGWRFEYVMPAVEPIDPRKDLEADILAVRAGRMSPQEFIGGWGRDWRDVVADFESFLTTIDGAMAGKGLVFDIDPRRTSRVGVAQSTGYATDETAPTSIPGT
jgi:lambda family phage portal protein